MSAPKVETTVCTKETFMEELKGKLLACHQDRKDVRSEVHGSKALLEQWTRWMRWVGPIGFDFEGATKEALAFRKICEIKKALETCLRKYYQESVARIRAESIVKAERERETSEEAAGMVSSVDPKYKEINDALVECRDKLGVYKNVFGRMVCPTETPDCADKSAPARRAYQNMMNHDFDHILRPKLYDHHYRHDDNIASATGGYYGDYQPLIRGEYNDIETIGSGFSMLIGVVGVSSVVIIIMLLFCVCLAFVIGIYYGYSQKSAFQRKRAKEERCWIDENRNET